MREGKGMEDGRMERGGGRGSLVLMAGTEGDRGCREIVRNAEGRIGGLSGQGDFVPVVKVH